MNGANLTDVGLLLPELILVGTALVLILAATLLASFLLAAGLSSCGDEPEFKQVSQEIDDE